VCLGERLEHVLAHMEAEADAFVIRQVLKTLGLKGQSAKSVTPQLP
jgi:hypothetical protein